MLPLKRAFEAYNKGINQEENENKKLFSPYSMVKRDDRALDDNASGPSSVSKNCSVNARMNKVTTSLSLNHLIKSYKNPPAHNCMRIQNTWTLQKNITKPSKAKRARSPKKKAAPRPIVSPDPYICTCCNLAFRRKVTYNQHIKEQQRKSSSSIISISSSSDESESPQMKRSKRKKKSEIEDPTFYPDHY